MLCNVGQREGVKPSPDLALGLFCYAPLHKIWYGILALALIAKSAAPKRTNMRMPRSYRTRRRTRGEGQTLEVALPIAPMKGEGGLDRVERRGSGPALDE